MVTWTARTYPVIFTNEYEHSIDDKFRLAIPVEFRRQWDEQRDGKAWFSVPWPGADPTQIGHLRLYTEMTFEQVLRSRPIEMFPDERESDRRASYFGLAARLIPDKQGRIILPDKQVRLTKLGREVTVVGAGDWLEVRDRATWAASELERFHRMPLRVAEPAPSGVNIPKPE